MSENNDILFDEYLNNQLNIDERIAFEQRLSQDEEFRKMFELHKQILLGISLVGENNLQNELTTIYTSNLNDISNKKYQPSINNNGFSLLSFLFRLFFIAFILFAVFTVLIVTNNFPFHHKKVDNYKIWVETVGKKVFVSRVDTVYYEIQSTDVAEGDTIIDFPDKRIIKSKSNSDTILKNGKTK